MAEEIWAWHSKKFVNISASFELDLLKGEKTALAQKHSTQDESSATSPHLQQQQ